MARPKRKKGKSPYTYKNRAATLKAQRAAARKANRAGFEKARTTAATARTKGRGKKLLKDDILTKGLRKGKQASGIISRPKWDITVSQVTSMRGRIHPSAQQPFDQPLSSQNVHVDSTAISSYRYSSKEKILEIIFLTSGARYWYFGVEFEVVKGLGVAGSKGRYFNRMIKNRYSYTKK